MRAYLLLCCLGLGGCFLSSAWREQHAAEHQRRVEAKAAQRAYREQYEAALRAKCLEQPLECERLRIERKPQKTRTYCSQGLGGFNCVTRGN